MTYPGTTTYPGTGIFPGQGLYVPGTSKVPYLSIGSWAASGVDNNGVKWKLLTLSGFDEPPPVKGGDTPRSNADGSDDGPLFNDDRVISWSGSVDAPDRATRAIAKANLSRIARALREGAVLVGHMDDGIYTVTAKRASGWTVLPRGDNGWKYQAVVTCADPYKYGLPVSTPPTGVPGAGATGLKFPLFAGTGKLAFGRRGSLGQVTVGNPGTADAWPVYVINGSLLGGFALTETEQGRSIVYPGDVPEQSVLTIDSATGYVDLNGSDRSGDLTVAQWWPVAAGTYSTVQFSPLGPAGQSGTAFATLRPTYE
jgi:hypothetical protein